MQTLKEKLEILLAASTQTPPSVEVDVCGKWTQYSIEAVLKFGLDDFLVRPLDPHHELKAAHATGKVIEWRFKDGVAWQVKTANFDDWPASCEYRIKLDEPWSLHEHVAKFFGPPPKDAKFHREDWTADMLPEGWRPLLEGEDRQGCDEVRDNFQDKKFVILESIALGDEKTITSIAPFHRTRRPYPQPTRRVPLEAKDVPPGSVFRPIEWGDTPSFVTLASVRKMAVVFNAGDLGKHLCDQGKCASTSWHVLMDQWLIKRPGEDWQPCSKEISA